MSGHIKTTKHNIAKHNIAKHVGRRSFLGRTLPSLLYHACATYPNPRAFAQNVNGSWAYYSSDEFKEAAEEFALGMLDIGLAAGDRVALYQESDVYFCLSDMGCLIAGLVNVPVYLTHTPESIKYVLGHADAHAVIASSGDRFDELVEALEFPCGVRYIILTEPADDIEALGIPEEITLMTMSDVRARGRTIMASDSDRVRELSDRLDPSDLCTIIYTSGTTGRPKGVMLTHENISSNALMSYSGIDTYQPGEDGEVMLSFLPLTHVFARTLYYGALAHGTSLYFSHPDRLVQDLLRVRPTVISTVPRLLEKVYAKIISRTRTATGLKGKIARWGLKRAQGGSTSASKGGASGLSKAADALVYKKWRAVFGGRMRWIISGGAALSGEISEVFASAGITILQGYGLTETSPVIAFNRPNNNRAGTVGRALEGLEISIAEDGEILTRGPHIMAGYFRDDERTAVTIDEDGWLSTGDIGELSEDGFLTITDRKKDLFKLSTGKYVMPQPLENKLSAAPLIDQSVVIGIGHKFATALIFPNAENMQELARTSGISASTDLKTLCVNEKMRAEVSQLVDRANEGLSHWNTIKRFTLVAAELSVENDLLTPTLKVKRANVRKAFSDEIQKLYADENDDLDDSKGTEELN